MSFVRFFFFFFLNIKLDVSQELRFHGYAMHIQFYFNLLMTYHWNLWQREWARWYFLETSCAASAAVTVFVRFPMKAMIAFVWLLLMSSIPSSIFCLQP